VGFLRLCARRYRGQEQGLALVLTLFVVALVTVLVLEYHFDAAVEIDLAMNYAGDVQAYHLALAGVRFAQALLQQAPKDTNGPEDTWYKLGLVPACFSPQQLLDLATAGLGEGVPTEGRDAKTALSQRAADHRVEDIGQESAGCVSLRITDENSKLPINALRPPISDENQQPDNRWVNIFKRFFESFKIDPEVVDALVDWLDIGDNPRGTGGAERSYYESLPIPYAPPNGPMRTPGELRLVKGLDDAETLAKLFPGATPEAIADLDLGSNNYLTPFGAEQTQPGTQTGTQTDSQTDSQTGSRTGTQTGTQTGSQTGTQTGSQTANQAAKVNVNTASPEVLKALIVGVQAGGQTARSNAEGVVEEIVAKRQEKKLKNLNEAVQDANLRRTLGNVADVKSTHFRIEAVGVVGIVQKKIVAVLKRDSQSANPRNPANPANQMTMLYFKVE
jgi:type II secretory pathway component PulK